jgi:polysaccharide pyruvyl transferase WcaK-like protein
MQRIINYGSFLQAYALKKSIEKLGAECYFIDIKRGVQLPGNEMTNSIVAIIQRIIRVTYNLFINRRQTLTSYKYKKILRKKFVNEYYNILGLSKKYGGKYDMVIIGSDEVFNCCKKSIWGYSKQLFGEGVNAANVISYAASFGSTTLNKIEKFKITEDLGRALQNFKAISVRDDNSAQIIAELTGNAPLMHLDPVFIHNFNNEIEGCNIDIKNYIVIYTYINRIKEKVEIEEIKKFAKKHNKKLVSIFCWYTWCDELLIPNTPFEVLAYFENADFIITDTFHGTIFSIIKEKKFCTFIRDTNCQKLNSLIKFFNLQSRIVDKADRLEEILNTEIPYDDIRKKIKKEKNKSMQYLNVHLNNCQ